MQANLALAIEVLCASIDPYVLDRAYFPQMVHGGLRQRPNVSPTGSHGVGLPTGMGGHGIAMCKLPNIIVESGLERKTW